MSDPRALEIDRPVENNEFVRARELLPRHRFVSFHEETLPALVLAHGSLVTEDLVGVAPVGFVLPTSEAFTYVPAPGGIEIRRGAEAAGVLVQLDEATFSDFANEIHSASGLVLGQRIAFVRGGLDGLKRWEPALRALYHGRRIWTPAEASALVDAQGACLDLQRTFRLSDSDREMREFLEVAGFLHLRDVFTTEEVRRFGDEVDRVRAALVPGEGDCWWSTTRSGNQVVTRINYLDRWSALLKEAAFEPRVQRVGRLLGAHFRVCDDRLDGPMVFIKNSDVDKGLGDLEWHRDHDLGGHPLMCPLLQVGIQLDRANAENGQLFVLAGSHRHSNHPLAWGDEDGMPVVRFETEPGDVTVHFGDIFHTTPPPIGANAGRRVLYYKFARPETFEAIPAGAHYNDLLFKAGAGGRIATRADTWAAEDDQRSLPTESIRRV